MSHFCTQLTPLYKPLHAYVRQKLQLLYADNEFPETGHIPAHILGDMWASYWTHLINENSIVPYPGRAISVDTTQAMKEKVCSIYYLVRDIKNYD